jgi:hypothetical protein
MIGHRQRQRSSEMCNKRKSPTTDSERRPCRHRIDYNRGIGQMREWFVKGLSLAGVKPEDVPVELNI